MQKYVVTGFPNLITQHTNIRQDHLMDLHLCHTLLVLALLRIADPEKAWTFKEILAFQNARLKRERGAVKFTQFFEKHLQKKQPL